MMFDNLPGRNLDRYRILRQVGENPLGPIFQAHDPNLQRDVAIQLIQPSITARPDFSDDFIRTARAAARLDHPNLVQVFDFSQSREASYLVMEFIPGDHLEGLLHEMRRSGQWILLGEAVQIVRQMAHVMEYVRVQGVPQRSVNPSAIMFKPVPNDNLPYLPVLTDLGFAGVLEWGLAENPLIDPIYLSPEGAVGRATDARSDVYVLGILLYELVTGQPPFPIESIEDAVRYHTRQPLPAPRSVRPDIPAGLEAIIVRALEKNTEARYPNPGALANELERVLPAAQEVRSAPPVLESAVSLLVPYRLSVEGRLVRPSIPPSEPSREEPPVPAAATQVAGAAGSGRQAELDIFLERNQVSLEPGSTVTLGVNLVNRGSTPGRGAQCLGFHQSGTGAAGAGGAKNRHGDHTPAALAPEPGRALSADPAGDWPAGRDGNSRGQGNPLAGGVHPVHQRTAHPPRPFGRKCPANDQQPGECARDFHDPHA